MHATLTYHLTHNESRVSQELLHNLYVDNVVSGCLNESASLAYFAQSRSILSSAKFNLHSCASNSVQLMTTAKQHKAAEENNPVKVLGLWWDTHSHLIYPSPKPNASHPTTTTKRDILKWTSTIFDPLGLISPVTISSKLFLQNLWQQHVNWDTKLSEELHTTWNQISLDIMQATELPFPDSAFPHYQHQSQPYTYLQMLSHWHMVQLYIYNKGQIAHS